jgi:hypothetical protein
MVLKYVGFVQLRSRVYSFASNYIKLFSSENIHAIKPKIDNQNRGAFHSKNPVHFVKKSGTNPEKIHEILKIR